MKKLALGIATAAVLFTAVPAMAFGVHVGVGGVGIGAGGGRYYGGCGYNYPCGGYYDYYSGPSVYVGGGPHHHWHHR